MEGHTWHHKAQGTCPLPAMAGFESLEVTGETWLGAARAILYRRAPKSLYHVIYIRREPISLCLFNVQNVKAFFRLGLISLSSIRATVLPSWEQIALPAAETGSSVKGTGDASHHPMLSRFRTAALKSYQGLSSLEEGVLQLDGLS